MSSEKFIQNKIALTTLICACVVVLMSLSVRQVFGMFFIDFNNDLGISNTEFGLAIGIQMLGWGLSGPIFGAIADKYGGHKDQLSKSYWGMDRFRIKSIENIIKNFDLTYKQKKQAKKELIKKLKIIINGAFKRNNLSIVNEFSTKLEYWDKVNF